MTELAPLTTTPTRPGTQPAAAPQGSAAQISSDFEVFLKMLTAQMQYQDPLNPIDSTDYATQLATFSGVEQAVMTNDLLKSLTAQLGVGGLSEMATWVGKEARAAGPVRFDGQAVTLFPMATDSAATWEISVRNADGQEVQRLPFAPSDESLIWSGLQFGGLQAPAGTYTFLAIGRTNGQVVSEQPVETYTRVTEVRLDNGEQMLVLDGGNSIPMQNVTALREG